MLWLGMGHPGICVWGEFGKDGWQAVGVVEPAIESIKEPVPKAPLLYRGLYQVLVGVAS